MKDIICWWSGGVTSAVACKLAIQFFGKKRCRVIMIDTKNEHHDTYRFKEDCQQWYSLEIETITGIGEKYPNIKEVWRKHKSLNVATGAICSTQLKRKVREDWQKKNEFDHQIFGFEFDKKEFNRALSMNLNHTKVKPIFPLLMMGYSKDDCMRIVEDEGIEIPIMYKLGFKNNNCFGTGCVQGGIGYWQKIRDEFPQKFEDMANMEHELTDLKGEPVTMLKDQTKEAKQKVLKTGKKWAQFIFLKKHPKYPEIISIDEKERGEVEPLFECNGFCGTNDLIERTESDGQINFQFDFK